MRHCPPFAAEDWFGHTKQALDTKCRFSKGHNNQTIIELQVVLYEVLFSLRANQYQHNGSCIMYIYFFLLSVKNFFGSRYSIKIIGHCTETITRLVNIGWRTPGS